MSTCRKFKKKKERKKERKKKRIASMGAFFWDYSGIGIIGIDGICVLLGAIPFSE